MRLALNILKWLLLIVLIIIALFFIAFGTSVHQMQSALISEIVQYIDANEFEKMGTIDRKGIAINHHFIFQSLITVICCLVVIIIFLGVSLIRAKRQLKECLNRLAVPAPETQ
jgi:ethanolamine utilization protein EutP (predicted NTPase)